jgi:hypothetical protein
MEGSLVAYKVFTNGSVLNASEINDNLMNQAVMVFSNAAARDAALTSPTEGMTVYLNDVNYLFIYSGTTWVPSLSNDSWTAYTPTITAASGSFTSVSATGLHKRIGKVCHVIINISITTNGTAAGNIRATVPFSQSAGIATGLYRENNVTGFSGQILVTGNQAIYYTSGNLYPGGNGYNIFSSFAYEVA